MAAAPPPAPEWTARLTVPTTARTRSRPHSGREKNMLLRALTSVGFAATAALIIFTVLPRGPVDATPAELLRRVGFHYRDLRDVELLFTPQSEALELLGKLLSDEEKPVEEPMSPFRVLLRHPNQFLVDFDVDPAIALDQGLLGFDGRDFWHYDEERGVIEVVAGDVLEFESTRVDVNGLDLRDANLVHLLSWGVIQRLNEAGDGFAVEEVTGPYERRVGHRAFLFDLRHRTTASSGEDGEGEEEDAEGKWLSIALASSSTRVPT